MKTLEEMGWKAKLEADDIIIYEKPDDEHGRSHQIYIFKDPTNLSSNTDLSPMEVEACLHVMKSRENE